MINLNSLPLPKLLQELIADDSLSRVIGAAIKEDLKSPGDITTQSLILKETKVQAELVARDGGVLAGLGLIPRIIGDSSIAFESSTSDGETCCPDQSVGTLTGDLRRILSLERI